MSSRSESRSVEILVIGAGVLGLSTAAELTARGHRVRVLDPGGLNASSVAAGMIAPALESAIDDVTPERAALLRGAAELWPGFAAMHGLTLMEGEAEWRGEGVDGIEARMKALGFASHRDGDRVLASDDLRVDAEAALTILAERLSGSVIKGQAAAISADETGWRVSHSNGVILAKIVVLATGAGAALAGLPDAVAARISAIQPIRGQIGRTAPLRPPGVVRGQGAYVASDARQSLIGATMDVGRRDLMPDPTQGADLAAALSRILAQQIDLAAVEWRVGVRGSTADGLPLAGASGASGLFLALAPRRNGWLLAPLVGRIVADAVEGGASSPDAAALDPLRPF